MNTDWKTLGIGWMTHLMATLAIGLFLHVWSFLVGHFIGVGLSLAMELLMRCRHRQHIYSNMSTYRS